MIGKYILKKVEVKKRILSTKVLWLWKTSQVRDGSRAVFDSIDIDISMPFLNVDISIHIFEYQYFGVKISNECFCVCFSFKNKCQRSEERGKVL